MKIRLIFAIKAIATKWGLYLLMGDHGYPYGLSINHWYCEEDGRIYFHSGKTGHKIDALNGCEKAIEEEGYETKVGYFYPSKQELNLLSTLEQSDIEQVILNISATVDLSFIEKFPKIKAVLLPYLPGMESGTAIADVLRGEVNPSSKLVDTIARFYEDYPTIEGFAQDPLQTVYTEGIYVGYRYFETFAKEKVLYPSGYGIFIENMLASAE